MNHSTKKWTIFLSTVILAAGITACGKKAADAPSASPNAASPSGSPAASPSGSPEQTPQTKQATGAFVGLADTHTAAINVDGTEQSYQFDEGPELTLTGLKTGDQVSFEYEEKALEGGGTQLVLTRIGKAAIPEGSTTGSSGGTAADLPATKEFTFKLEGNEEKRTGKLAAGHGFSLYVFDGFSFEPDMSLLTMDIDKNYYARIEKLPEGYKLEDIKKSAEKDLAKVGEVREEKQPNAALGGAVLMMIGSGDKLTQEVIVKEVDGTGYRIDINMPHTEANEGFGPHAFTSISSIVSP